jgi:hypothetical protein
VAPQARYAPLRGGQPAPVAPRAGARFPRRQPALPA